MRDRVRINEIGGEQGLIERISRNFAVSGGDGLSLGVGDDAALVDAPPDTDVVVTTDMLVENIHFRHDWSDPYSIGWKAAAVNLSDIAAMGADPTFTFLSIAFTADETVERLDRLFDGFVDCLTRYGARLAGGDTNASPQHMVLSVTQLGTVPRGQALRRDAARPGDILLVTGSLGASATALALLEALGPAKADRAAKDLVNLHRRPQPRIVAARAIAATGLVKAAMDLSDGLLTDARKLAMASGCGIQICAKVVPIHEAVPAAAELIDKDPLQLALAGGEDYELLLAVDPANVDEVTAAVQEAGVALTAVGEVTKSGVRVVAANGVDDVEIGSAGWDHFLS